MQTVGQKLLCTIADRGWSGRIVPVAHLADLEHAIRGRHKRGLFDETLHREALSSFSFEPPEDLPEARSIIVVAVPSPQTRVIFHWNGERIPVCVPPTYVGYTATNERVRATLAAWLEDDGYRVAAARLPLKTLAVRGGLAEWGRNNICYVPGMGSFLQLVGAFSDLPCDEDPWRAETPLELCESCVACLHSCPSGAISEDRFLLHAERCLTFHNERACEFPDWIDPSWHHCLVGCMRCQSVCPENKAVREWSEDGVEFSEAETALLVARTPLDQLPPETAAKMGSLGLSENHDMLCRNLSKLMA